MNNFKSNFLSRGQPGSRSIDKFFLSVVTVLQVFFGNLIFALTARMLSGNLLNTSIFLLLAKTYLYCFTKNEDSNFLGDFLVFPLSCVVMACGLLT